MVLAQVVPEILEKTIRLAIMPPPPILIRVKQMMSSCEQLLLEKKLTNYGHCFASLKLKIQ